MRVRRDPPNGCAVREWRVAARGTVIEPDGSGRRLDPPYEGVNLLRDWSKKIADAAATMILYEH
jgi:hypothetical protein